MAARSSSKTHNICEHFEKILCEVLVEEIEKKRNLKNIKAGKYEREVAKILAQQRKLCTPQKPPPFVSSNIYNKSSSAYNLNDNERKEQNGGNATATQNREEKKEAFADKKGEFERTNEESNKKHDAELTNGPIVFNLLDDEEQTSEWFEHRVYVRHPKYAPTKRERYRRRYGVNDEKEFFKFYKRPKLDKNIAEEANNTASCFPTNEEGEEEKEKEEMVQKASNAASLQNAHSSNSFAWTGSPTLNDSESNSTLDNEYDSNNNSNNTDCTNSIDNCNDGSKRMIEEDCKTNNLKIINENLLSYSEVNTQETDALDHLVMPEEKINENEEQETKIEEMENTQKKVEEEREETQDEKCCQAVSEEEEEKNEAVKKNVERIEKREDEKKKGVAKLDQEKLPTAEENNKQKLLEKKMETEDEKMEVYENAKKDNTLTESHDNNKPNIIRTNTQNKNNKDDRHDENNREVNVEEKKEILEDTEIHSKEEKVAFAATYDSVDILNVITNNSKNKDIQVNNNRQSSSKTKENASLPGWCNIQNISSGSVEAIYLGIWECPNYTCLLGEKEVPCTWVYRFLHNKKIDTFSDDKCHKNGDGNNDTSQHTSSSNVCTDDHACNENNNSKTEQPPSSIHSENSAAVRNSNNNAAINDEKRYVDSTNTRNTEGKTNRENSCEKDCNNSNNKTEEDYNCNNDSSHNNVNGKSDNDDCTTEKIRNIITKQEEESLNWLFLKGRRMYKEGHKKRYVRPLRYYSIQNMSSLSASTYQRKQFSEMLNRAFMRASALLNSRGLLKYFGGSGGGKGRGDILNFHQSSLGIPPQRFSKRVSRILKQPPIDAYWVKRFWFAKNFPSKFNSVKNNTTNFNYFNNNNYNANAITTGGEEKLNCSNNKNNTNVSSSNACAVDQKFSSSSSASSSSSSASSFPSSAKNTFESNKENQKDDGTKTDERESDSLNVFSSNASQTEKKKKKRKNLSSSSFGSVPSFCSSCLSSSIMNDTSQQKRERILNTCTYSAGTNGSRIGGGNNDENPAKRREEELIDMLVDIASPEVLENIRKTNRIDISFPTTFELEHAKLPDALIDPMTLRIGESRLWNVNAWMYKLQKLAKFINFPRERTVTTTTVDTFFSLNSNSNNNTAGGGPSTASSNATSFANNKHNTAGKKANKANSTPTQSANQ